MRSFRIAMTILALTALGHGNGRLAFAQSPAHPLTVPPEAMVKNCIKMVSPAYPFIARAAGLRGMVVMHALISKSGDVTPGEVVQGHPMLFNAAVDAVREWKYKPYLVGGHPVAVATEISVKFDLGPDRVVSYPNGAPETAPQPSAATFALDTQEGLNRAFGPDGRLKFIVEPDSRKDVTVDRAGNVYILDLQNHSLSKIAAATGKRSAVATEILDRGVGSMPLESQLAAMGNVAVDGAGDLYVNVASNVYRIAAKSGEVTLLGSAVMEKDDPYQRRGQNPLYGLAVNAEGDFYVSTDTGIRRKSATTGITIELIALQQGNSAKAGINFAVDAGGNLYVKNDRLIKKVSIETGKAAVVAGRGGPWTDPRVQLRDGVAAASVNELHPDGGMAVDAIGNIYFASKGVVWKTNEKTGTISRVVALPQAYQNGKFMIDGAGNLYVVCDGFIQRFQMPAAGAAIHNGAQTLGY